MKYIFEILLYFYIYSFLGWVCESIYCSIGSKKIINRGFLSGPICPIYGFGALLTIFMLGSLKSTILVFIYGIIITSTLEFIGGYLLETIFHTRWWDYSKRKFNIKGRVCLRNSILFGLLCLALIKLINPIVEGLVSQIPEVMLIIVVIISVTLFIVDFIFTINAINRLNHKLKDLDNIIDELNKAPEKRNNEFYNSEIKFIKHKSTLQRRIINAFPDMKHKNRHEQLLYVKKVIKDKFK